MNSEELGSLARKVLLMVLTSVATKYHIDGSTTTAVVTDIVDLGVLAWGIYAHWNMKKVPETAITVQQAGGR